MPIDPPFRNPTFFMSQGGEDGENNDKTSSGTEVDVLYSGQAENSNDFAKDDDYIESNINIGFSHR